MYYGFVNNNTDCELQITNITNWSKENNVDIKIVGDNIDPKMVMDLFKQLLDSNDILVFNSIKDLVQYTNSSFKNTSNILNFFKNKDVKIICLEVDYLFKGFPNTTGLIHTVVTDLLYSILIYVYCNGYELTKLAKEYKEGK